MKTSSASNNGKDYTSFFKTVPMFSQLGSDQLKILSDHATESCYEKGQIICRKDTYAHTVYIVKSGTVTEFAVDGNEFSIAVKTGRKLACFGELGVLLGEVYVTSVVASSKVAIISIPDEVFCRVLWENQSVVKELFRLCLKRLQKSAQKSLSLTMFNSEGRLAYILLMMHNENTGSKYMTVTQESLSTRCGIARQTASTALNNWKKGGIVDIQRGKIAVVDVPALTDIVISSAKTF